MGSLMQRFSHLYSYLYTWNYAFVEVRLQVVYELVRVGLQWKDYEPAISGCCHIMHQRSR